MDWVDLCEVKAGANADSLVDWFDAEILEVV